MPRTGKEAKMFLREDGISSTGLDNTSGEGYLRE